MHACAIATTLETYKIRRKVGKSQAGRKQGEEGEEEKEGKEDVFVGSRDPWCSSKVNPVNPYDLPWFSHY